MRKQNAIKRSVVLGILTTSAFGAVGAEKNAINRLSEEGQNKDVITVTTTHKTLKAGSEQHITAGELERNGAGDFGAVMRYQPLISATGASGGTSNGKSGFDRSGYTGYNIRGLESNRVGIDVDGIPQPNATGRAYVGRAGQDTFGIGRDYIDPYMYGRVDIQSGATSAETANMAMGGLVSFRSKSADFYLTPEKRHYFNYRSQYDDASRSWHNGMTAAGGDGALRGLVVYSRRDGQQTRNNSGTLEAYPVNWHSDAFLASGAWQANAQHKLSAVVDYFAKTNNTRYDAWSPFGTRITGKEDQSSHTRRWGISLTDFWLPSGGGVDHLSSTVYYQHSEAHDRTWMPGIFGGMQTVTSNYDTNIWGFHSGLVKNLGRHDISAGINGSYAQTRRPLRQYPALSIYDPIMQPETDSRAVAFGAFVQDQIHFDLNGHDFSLTPGLRVAYQNTTPQNSASLAVGSSAITGSDIDRLYGGGNRDTQWLPSLTAGYGLTPELLTYLQYRRSARFPDASQLYGSWNLGSSTARRYALAGNRNLNAETGDNLEWGLKGQVTPGVSLRAALFYNRYSNFIAYTRYTRGGTPARFGNIPSNINIIYQAENRDKAYIYGGELSSKINYGSWFESVDGLSSTFALGYSMGKSKSSYDGDTYVDLDSVPPMKGIVGIAWDHPAKAYGTALKATFTQGKRGERTNRESYANTGAALTASSKAYMRVPGYGLLDWTAYWQVSKQVKLNTGVSNITDRKYWDYLSSRSIAEVTEQDAWQKALAVMPGRTWQLGVNITF